MPAELTSVSECSVTVHVDRRVVVADGLAPDTAVTVEGVEARTLPRPGELLATVATTNDVHFGETECGRIDGTDIGPILRSGPSEDPYPEVMNRAVVAEIVALNPAAVVVKGDLTSAGTIEEYQAFLDCYAPVADRMVHVRGNHDSGGFAAWPTQEVTVDGAVLAVLDTSRPGKVGGSLSADQLEWLDELASRADRPVLVFGHHPVWHPHEDLLPPLPEEPFGLNAADSHALIDVFARRTRLAGYFAGHTHRNRRRTIPVTGDVPWAEVACVKDFPGAWAEYRIFDGGILAVHHRVAEPAALDWAERTRHLYDGTYEQYALGDLSDRSYLITPRT